MGLVFILNAESAFQYYCEREPLDANRRRPTKVRLKIVKIAELSIIATQSWPGCPDTYAPS